MAKSRRQQLEEQLEERAARLGLSMVTYDPGNDWKRYIFSTRPPNPQGPGDRDSVSGALCYRDADAWLDGATTMYNLSHRKESTDGTGCKA